MTLFLWSDAMNTGIDAVDRQHRRLVQHINDLHEAMESGRDRAFLAGLLRDLVTYTSTHFSAEEKLMELNGYPDFVVHRETHRRFVERLSRYQSDQMMGRPVLTRDVMGLLKEWLMNHILELDQRYAPYLRAKGVK